MSTFSNNVASNITAIQEIISDAGLFNEKYQDVLNIADTINNQVKTYNKLSKSSINRDLYDMAFGSIDFDKERKTLSEKLRQKECPEYGVLEAIPAPRFKLNRLDSDVFSDMWSNLVVDDKKAIRRYINKRNEVSANLSDFTSEIEQFENNMVKHRNNVCGLLKKNTAELFNIHAAYAWTIKHKQPIDEFAEMGLVLKNSQKEFVTENLKKMLNIENSD